MKKMVWLLSSLLLCAVPAWAQQNKAAQSNWAQWRGPADNGVARSDAPTTWSEKENIRWKANIPGRGHSTPVVWGNRIFLTTAVPINPDALTAAPAEPPAGGRQGSGRGAGGGSGAGVEHKLIVMCLDRKTGKALWQHSPKTAVPHEGYHRMYGSFASNSPVTDGRYLWAFFGSRGLYCYDLNGKLLWQKDFEVQMKMRLQFGEGGAPAMAEDRLVLLFDHEGASFIVAVDKKSGKELWRNTRDETSSWTTPLILEHNGSRQVVVTGTRKVRSYDLTTGKLIWECAGLGVNVIPQPIHHDGVVYVMSGYVRPNLMAIKLGREGDLTGTDAVLWSQNKGLSYTASPVFYDGKFYAVTDNGMVSCFDAKTGTPYYQQQRLPKPYNVKASPVAANGKLYVPTEDGDVVVIKLGEKYEVLATNSLPDQFFIASPVILDGEMLLRSQNTLYCISGRK
ncbi:MAG: PQQ-binding-like beta-propeller repeat protein [Blastocatellia bacterium]|nr:PQQ-binding-like beta-propeller repeat protein [Blastocatellia bacterium]